MKQREIFQLFDVVFKCLMSFSDQAVVHCINGLFGTNYPPESKVSRPSTEAVDGSLKRSLADMVIIINDTHRYLIETQISNDDDIIMRIFRYILNEGQRSAAREEKHILRISVPEARVIYWESTRNTPDREILRFEFPGGRIFDLEAPSFKFPDYSIADLEERRMWLLLPFCLLKLRKDVVAAKTDKKLRELSGEVKKTIYKLAETAERGQKQGYISGLDLINILELTQCLYRELYSGYNEFDKEWEMVRTIEDLKLTDWAGLWRQKEEEFEKKEEEFEKKEEEFGKKEEEFGKKEEEFGKKLKLIAKNMKARGVPAVQIAEDTGLSLEKIEAL
jgi:hypothetical protein